MANKSNKSGVIIFSISVIAAIAVLIGSGIISVNIPEHIPSPPSGNAPLRTYKTTVVVKNPVILSNPYITYISTTPLNYIESGKVMHIQFLPWGGTLKLTIVYPDGSIRSIDRKITIDWATERAYTFIWQTRQNGTHILKAQLIDGNGNVVSSKSEEFVVGVTGGA